MASYMLPHRRGLGRDAQAATSAEKKREMAAMGISPSSNTDEPYTRERGLASAGSRAERRRAQEQARDAAAAAGGFVGGGPSPAAGGFVGGNPAPPPRGRPDDGGDDPDSDRRPAAAPRKLKLSAQRLMRNALHAHNYGLHQNALEAFDAALGSPEGRSTDLIRAECMAHKAATLHAMGRHTDALACAEEAKRLDPKQPRAYFGLALARDGLGEPMKSMDAIQDGMRCQAKSGSIFDPVIELIKPKLQALTKLKDAAEKGNLPECEKLADRLDGFGFPAMKSLSSGEPRKEITVAHAAVDGGQLEVIAFLGARGFDLDVADCEGDTPLASLFFGDRGRGGGHHVRGDAWKAIAAALLAAGADPRARGADGLPPLHRALDVGDVDVAAVLYDHDATILARCPDAAGRSPLHAACAVPGEANEIVKHGCVEWLLARGGPDLLLAKDAEGRVPLKLLRHDADAVDAKIKKWISAWLRLARKAKLVGALPPPPPYDQGDAGAAPEPARDGRARGFRARLVDDGAVEPPKPRFKPELHAIPITDQYRRFDAIDYDREKADAPPAAE